MIKIYIKFIIMISIEKNYFESNKIYFRIGLS